MRGGIDGWRALSGQKRADVVVSASGHVVRLHVAAIEADLHRQISVEPLSLEGVEQAPDVDHAATGRLAVDVGEMDASPFGRVRCSWLRQDAVRKRRRFNRLSRNLLKSKDRRSSVRLGS